jgi:hypothetical protein
MRLGKARQPIPNSQNIRTRFGSPVGHHLAKVEILFKLT